MPITKVWLTSPEEDIAGFVKNDDTPSWAPEYKALFNQYKKINSDLEWESFEFSIKCEQVNIEPLD